MANFETHWKVGLGVSSLGALAMTWAQLSTPKQLPIIVAVGLIGSIAPDMDSDTSRPLKIIFNGLAILLPPILIWRIPRLHETGERTLLFWILAIFLISVPLKWCFKQFTTHRGVMHSIPAAFIFGGIAFSLARHEHASHLLQLSVGIAATLGYLTHLTLDEIWAVDFNGVAFRKKRSFGTALCWTGRSIFQNIMLYSILGIIGWYCWIQWVEESSAFTLYQF